MKRSRLPLPAIIRPLAVFAMGAVFSFVASAQGNSPLHQRIDQLVAEKTPGYSSLAAPVADDAEFLRRVYLDFIGRIPSIAEARSFLNDKSMGKRAKLIDDLLKRPEFARHMATVFDVTLMERRPQKHVPVAQWQEFLRTSFAANKPYDQLVREILAADGSDPKTRPAARFYLDRLAEPHLITKDVSRLFMGMNLQCAQCHDHPLVESYKQDFYYGVYAFFSRSYLFNDRKKKRSVYAEKGVGEVSFQSVFKPKITKKTGPRLPGLPPIKEPEFKKGQEYKVKPSKTAAGVPKFSRRDRLPELLASAGNERFKRAAVNRFWFLLMGRGIVNPIDFDHPANPPSHPKLLDYLAEEFARSKFDVKKLMREIALSKTYQRSSQMPKGKELPAEKTFALAAVRPLSPEQMTWSVMEATGIIEGQRLALKKKATEAAIWKRLSRNVAPFVKIYGGQAGDPADLGFQATLDQTLFLRNGSLVRGWLAPRTGSLTQRLLTKKSDDELAEELFLSVLTRYPTAEEKADTRKFLADNQGNRTAALQEMAWALIASAEFRFNH